MKMSLLLILSVFSVSAFAGPCARVVENFFLNEGIQTERPILLLQDGDLQQYTIRTNEHGGQAEHLVTVTNDCKIVEVKTLWAE